jgi:MoaA/NifB/PqqE/SkfB family radical SAM enzyme
MTSILQRWFPFTRPADPIRPGVYASQPKADAAVPYRLHLRVETDGSGVLLVNASTILHLNDSATAHALEIIREATVPDAARAVRSRFRVSRQRALADQQQLRDQILRVATQPDLDPVVYLGMERRTPFAERPSAPYRLDLALTYTTDPSGKLDPLARKRVKRELTEKEWKAILSSAWAAGIPHVTFTGGEPTRRKDLVRLIGYAQELGQVTGLLTEGRRFADAKYIRAIEAAGLDHILLSYLPGDKASKAGLLAALATDIYTAVHLSLSGSQKKFAAVLREVKELGVPAVSLTSVHPGAAGRKLLDGCSQAAADLGLELVWDLPAPYSARHPIQLDLDEPALGSGRAWLYVEPDGDVLPGQGVDKILGHALKDSWADLWARASA